MFQSIGNYFRNQAQTAAFDHIKNKGAEFISKATGHKKEDVKGFFGKMTEGTPVTVAGLALAGVMLAEAATSQGMIKKVAGIGLAGLLAVGSLYMGLNGFNKGNAPAENDPVQPQQAEDDSTQPSQGGFWGSLRNAWDNLPSFGGNQPEKANTDVKTDATKEAHTDVKTDATKEAHTDVKTDATKEAKPSETTDKPEPDASTNDNYWYNMGANIARDIYNAGAFIVNGIGSLLFAGPQREETAKDAEPPLPTSTKAKGPTSEAASAA